MICENVRDELELSKWIFITAGNSKYRGDETAWHSTSK
jgi:hypothetical protein